MKQIIMALSVIGLLYGCQAEVKIQSTPEESLKATPDTLSVRIIPTYIKVEMGTLSGDWISSDGKGTAPQVYEIYIAGKTSAQVTEQNEIGGEYVYEAVKPEHGNKIVFDTQYNRKAVKPPTIYIADCRMTFWTDIEDSLFVGETVRRIQSIIDSKQDEFIMIEYYVGDILRTDYTCDNLCSITFE